MSELPFNLNMAKSEHSRYPDYPKVRLVLSETELMPLDGKIDIPDGLHTMNNAPLPTPEETENFEKAGYQTDTQGRPLHPWFKRLVTDPEVGIITGKGSLWNWGPNYTVDTVLVTNQERPKILLIQLHSDTWAIPGGFLENIEQQIEDPETAAKEAGGRELYEEAGVSIDGIELTPFYQGPVSDGRMTANAWIETSGFVGIVGNTLPTRIHDTKEVKNVKWVYLDELPKDLRGSHRELIRLAIEMSGVTRLTS